MHPLTLLRRSTKRRVSKSTRLRAKSLGVFVHGLAWALVAAGLSGCAGIDFDYPRVESMAPRDTDDTWLGQQYADAVADLPDGYSGFFPLEDGIKALTARLLLAQKAEQSIDTQYFLIKSDTAGYALVDALLRAADRGVHVRFLLDDIFTKGYDAGMAALDSHPNFEIRIFNPFNRGAMGAAYAGTTNLSRVNRRMHTKSFTVDSQVTIVGGRNIGDEYFGANESEKFGDLDVIGIGTVAGDVSTMFDTFWNHSTALPVPAFAIMPDDPAAELERLRAVLAEQRETVLQTEYADAVKATAARFMDKDPSVFEFAPYQLVYDTPDKGIKSRDGATQDITEPLIESLMAAEEEVIVLSPYFVPLKSGIAFFSELEARGVKVVIVTNSLAANNHAMVHGGYAPSRKPLLRNGVELYEVRPDANVPGTEFVDADDARATMHTKAYIVDRKQVFIGSFNFDPRSAFLNTESGVLIDSPYFGKLFGERIDAEIIEQAWQVYLDDNGRMRWRGIENGEQAIYTSEPMATFGQKFTAAFMRILPVRKQL